ncbi:MAG: succinate dehydrogenase cytochrome b subunit [Armatimonadetes bacterium]|nr:succinate dehydrogenase cytochrome b subunit [Armatimonadota bacterium]
MKLLLVTLIRSSIGRKCIMALTGLGSLGFLFGHLYGNAYVYKGAERFDKYAHHLHELPFLPVIEAGLFAMFAIHITFAVVLTLQNWRARPVNYSMVKSAGGRTVASSTMIYTGLIILAFIVFHIWTVRTGDESAGEFNMISAILSQPWIVACYVFGVLALGLHLFHGISSTFQSLGLMHPMYDRFVIIVGRIGAVALTVAFASIPLFLLLALGGGFAR